MAEKQRRGLSENTRLRIKTTKLAERLEKHALSATEIMTSSQIRAAEILLNKTLPNKQQISGDENNPITANLNLTVTFK